MSYKEELGFFSDLCTTEMREIRICSHYILLKINEAVQ